MAALRVGPGVEAGTQVGPLVNEDTVAKVDSLVKGAIEAGAKAETGGERPPGKGFYYPPTVLTGVAPDSEILREEIDLGCQSCQRRPDLVSGIGNEPLHQGNASGEAIHEAIDGGDEHLDLARDLEVERGQVLGIA